VSRAFSTAFPGFYRTLKVNIIISFYFADEFVHAAALFALENILYDFVFGRWTAPPMLIALTP